MTRIPLRDVREVVSPLGEHVLLSDEVAAALAAAQPVVALETSLVTHGLPYPHCVDVSMDAAGRIRAGGAVPATIAVSDGHMVVGLSGDEGGSTRESPGHGQGDTSEPVRGHCPLPDRRNHRQRHHVDRQRLRDRCLLHRRARRGTPGRRRRREAVALGHARHLGRPRGTLPDAGERRVRWAEDHPRRTADPRVPRDQRCAAHDARRRRRR